MAKVFRENGFTGEIFPLDHHPPHIHVLKAGGEVVISIVDFSVIRIKKLTNRDIRKALALVEKYQAAAWEKWEDYHGQA